MPRRVACLAALLSISLLLAPYASGQPDEGQPDKKKAGKKEAVAPYGFATVEIYKIGWNCFSLRKAKIDGDACEDIVFVNNAKARIDIFLPRPDGVEPETDESDLEVNEFPEDRFFLKKELLTEKDVSALAIGDFNKDGKTDIAYYGKPPELVIAFGDGEAGFGKKREFAIEDGLSASSALAGGDLNGDGRDDLAYLTKKHTLLYYQNDAGEMAEPVRIPHGAKGVYAVGILDLNGDGKKDLVEVAGNNARPIRVRFQEAGGALGPEFSLKMAPFRSITFEDVDPNPGEEIVTIQRNSGLVRMLKLAEGEAKSGGIALGAVQIHPFEEASGGKGHQVATGDVDGDGRRDVLVTEPGTAQVALHLQTKDGAIGPRRLFPSLSETESVIAEDFAGDGKVEIVVLSSKEKTAGISALDADGRLSYPASLPIQGEPKAMAAGDLNGNGKPDLFVVTKHEDKWHGSVLSPAEAGELKLAKTFVLDKLNVKKDEPGAAMVIDADQDGRADVLLFDRYKAMRTLHQGEDGAFTDISDRPDYGGGLVEKKKRKDVSAIDLDGDGKKEFVVASKNFARALILSDGRWTVKDQVNARGSASQIKSMTGIDLTGDGQPEVALLDSQGNMLTILKRDESGVFQVAANFPVGTFTFEGLTAADLNGDGKEDLSILGRNRFGLVLAGGVDYELAEVHSFESPIKDAFLNDMAIGDLNGDGRPDVALTDARNHMIEILSIDPEKGFQHQLKWKVFQKKIHGSGGGARGSQPFDINTVDVNGDGLADLAVFVHDRLVIYPQEKLETQKD
jgi:hypothetical protein